MNSLEIEPDKTEKISVLRSINNQIFQFWTEMKPTVLRKRLKKKKKGTFTRSNGNKILALADTGWRYNNGLRGRVIKRPSIGYKRSSEIRFRRHADGLLFKLISDPKEILKHNLKAYEVFMLSSRMGARGRTIALNLAKENKKPLYINKIKNA